MIPDESFEASGPKHLTTVDWNNPQHLRSIMACFVQGAYSVERDRILERPPLAKDWWENFHYKLHDKYKLIDKLDGSIYGIVLKFNKPLASNKIQNSDAAPRYVVVFRGTMLDKEHVIRDVFLDLRVIVGGLNKSSRIENAIANVEKHVNKAGASNVWLTGHSLGASTATIIGKHMAKDKNINLKTFLFNPPFAKIPFDMVPLHDERVKERIHMAKTFFKVGLTYLLDQGHYKMPITNFAKLTSWTPYLFVHPADPISMSYIKYFEQRKELQATDASGVLKLVTQSSLREMMSNLFSKGSEMPHLLPSASLRVNRKKMDNSMMAHMISPWWEADLDLEKNDYLWEADLGSEKNELNSDEHDQTEIIEKTDDNCEESSNHEDENVKKLMQDALTESKGNNA